MTVADVVADGLARTGAARVFVSDGANATLAGALRAAGLSTIDAGGADAAVAMASVTGQLDTAPGLALISHDTDDVRASFLEAARARAPVVVLAAGGPSTSASIVKATAIVGAESAAHWAAHAAQAAMKEPPGPVWLTVAPDVVDRSALPLATAPRPAAAPLDLAQLDVVARHVGAATRPLIVAGRECRASAMAGWLRALAETLPAPVIVTPAARGVLPDPHPLCFGPLMADAGIVARADLVLALGVDADELREAGVTFVVPVVRLGQTEAWDARYGPTVAEASGDVAGLVEELAPRLRDRTRADWDVAEVDRLRRSRREPAVDAHVAVVIRALREATPAGTIAVMARELAAATPLWLAVNPGEIVIADLPVAAAVGASLQRPESAVLAFTQGLAGWTGADMRVTAQASAHVIVVALAVYAADLRELEAEGVRTTIAGSPSALALAIGHALAGGGSCVIAVPAPDA